MATGAATSADGIGQAQRLPIQGVPRPMSHYRKRMGIIRSRLARRFTTLGLISDLALVGAAAGRIFQRKGAPGAKSASMTEMALAGGAALRLLQRMRRRRKSRKLAA